MKPRTYLHLAIFLALAARAAVAETSTRLPAAKPADVGLDAAKLDQIDAAVQASIDKGHPPGAVVVVARQGKIAFRKAYGLRRKQPDEERMTADTLFDMASLTKPIATATSVMILLERGKLQLSDRVSHYLPEFGKNGKEAIAIEHLLLHTSGLIPDNLVKDYEDGRKKAWERICNLRPLTEPGQQFRYSDVGFIVLGELVERVSGEAVDVFARKHIFAPLGLRDTTFRPDKTLAERAATTEKRGDHWMRGEVHDPRSYHLGGVAGHAGLFSTADDLAVFAQMFLSGGSYEGKRILKPQTVWSMTTPRQLAKGRRTLGWDASTSFSSDRGDRFSTRSFGHTGYTGTFMWIDPDNQTVLILLSNRVHPNDKGQREIGLLRSKVASIVAASIVKPRGTGVSPVGSTSVLNGIDVLKRDDFRKLKGRRIGLMTNHTGVDREGRSTIDLLHQAEGVQLVALFSPEHGIRGEVERSIADSKDEKTRLPIYSLYGTRKRPIKEQLQGIDTLVYDIQDIGCRFYTYETTLGYLLETAAEHKLKIVVLDRPNPIGGVVVEGPVLDPKLESFVGYHPLPLRHGLTIGELARLFNRERKIDADLEIIPIEGWKRSDLFDRTNLLWINPSPNMRNLTAALLYPGIGLLETTNISVGRGTDRPFEIFGAPWIDGRRLAAALASASLPGLRFVPARFTPKGSIYAGKECGGVQIYIDNWQQFQSLPLGITIAYQLRKLYPEEWQIKGYG
ncbi:MAG TPA: exo-beta-N-acetylmuramidase NamZ domain-containing protein, partial [Gemmataceae bacterium]|nr:exo-beta-N-acetylmuramidase NamZ domain-containing protein [Gemmataceae bacterium]